MSTLEEFVNITLKNNGIRVSSCLQIRECLMRAIDISCRSKGVSVDITELETIASLIQLRYSSMPHPSKWTMDELETLVSEKKVLNDRVTRSSSHSLSFKAMPTLTRTISLEQGHAMIRRSQVV